MLGDGVDDDLLGDGVAPGASVVVAKSADHAGGIEGQLVHAVHEGVGVKVMLNSVEPASKAKTGQSMS